MNVEHRLSVGARGKNTDSGYLVGAIDGNKHGIGRPGFRPAGPDNHLAAANASNKDHLAMGNPVVKGEFLDATGNDISILQTEDENTPGISFFSTHLCIPPVNYGFSVMIA